jgi:hypothetical protein
VSPDSEYEASVPREVAQLGAVLGREFAYEMLRAITALDEPRLRDVLGRLVEEKARSQPRQFALTSALCVRS